MYVNLKIFAVGTSSKYYQSQNNSFNLVLGSLQNIDLYEYLFNGKGDIIYHNSGLTLNKYQIVMLTGLAIELISNNPYLQPFIL